MDALAVPLDPQQRRTRHTFRLRLSIQSALGELVLVAQHHAADNTVATSHLKTQA